MFCYKVTMPLNWLKQRLGLIKKPVVKTEDIAPKQQEAVRVMQKK